MTFEGNGLCLAIKKKAEMPYPKGTCLLVVSDLNLSPDDVVRIENPDTGLLEPIDQRKEVRDYLSTTDHPFNIVWRSILMPWGHDGGDSVFTLFGDEQGLRADLTNLLTHT